MKKTAIFLTSFLLFSGAFLLSHGTAAIQGEDSTLATRSDQAWARYEEKIVNVAKTEAERIFKKAEAEILEERKIKLYKQAVRSYPEHYPSLFKLGWYLQKRNLRQMSADYYKRCIKANPNHFAAYNNLGNIYKDWRDFDKAVLFYEKAMKINPGYALAPLNLGNLYRMQRRFEPAKKYYRKTLSIDPDNFWANLNLGSVLMVSAVTDSQHNFVGANPTDEDLNTAEFYFKRALSIRPGETVTTKQLALLHEYKTEYEEACRIYSKLIKPNLPFLTRKNLTGLKARVLKKGDLGKECSPLLTKKSPVEPTSDLPEFHNPVWSN